MYAFFLAELTPFGLILNLAFYLILDVGIGGTNGWFPDSPDKPWLNGSPSKFLRSLAVPDDA